VTEPSVLVDVDDGVATIRLNRPDRLNAFDTDMLRRLDEAVDGIDARADLHGVIVTGVGRGFCSGRDLAELGAIGDAERRRALPHAGGHESSMFARIEVPTVAAVNGPAVGGGLGFAVQCDYIVGAQGVRLKDGHLASGVVPSVAAWYIPRRIGAWSAMRFFAAADGMTAEEALAIGLIDEVVSAGDLLTTARARLDAFRAVDSERLRHLKRLAVTARASTIEEQMERVGLLRGLERRERDA
jgi:enoyl-CoA hydratase/carnithine racemase